MSIVDLTLGNLLSRAIDAKTSALRVAMPGEIVAFSEAEQVVDVQPLLPDVQLDESGEPFANYPPVVTNVPVWFPGGGLDQITYPIDRGMQCLLIFCDRSLDNWIRSGALQPGTDPRSHHLSDAIALVGLRAAVTPRAEYDPRALQLGRAGGPRIRFTSDAVHAGVTWGTDGTQTAIRGTAYRQAEDAFFQGLVNKLSAAASGATSLATALTALAAAAATPPLTPLSAAFSTAATGATTLATQLASVAGDLQLFDVSKSSYVTDQLKLP